MLISMSQRQIQISVTFLPGAIIGDGDRKRALILLLGLSPWYGTIFLFLSLKQNAPSPVTRAHILRGFLRMSRGGSDVRNPRKCMMLLAHNSTQLNTVKSVRILLQYFRHKLLQFKWSKTVLNLVMSCFIYHWPSYIPLLLLQELHITSLQVSHMFKNTAFP